MSDREKNTDYSENMEDIVNKMNYGDTDSDASSASSDEESPEVVALKEQLINGEITAEEFTAKYNELMKGDTDPEEKVEENSPVNEMAEGFDRMNAEDRGKYLEDVKDAFVKGELLPEILFEATGVSGEELKDYMEERQELTPETEALLKEADTVDPGSDYYTKGSHETAGEVLSDPTGNQDGSDASDLSYDDMVTLLGKRIRNKGISDEVREGLLNKDNPSANDEDTVNIKVDDDNEEDEKNPTDHASDTRSESTVDINANVDSNFGLSDADLYDNVSVNSDDSKAKDDTGSVVENSSLPDDADLAEEKDDLNDETASESSTGSDSTIHINANEDQNQDADGIKVTVDDDDGVDIAMDDGGDDSKLSDDEYPDADGVEMNEEEGMD